MEVSESSFGVLLLELVVESNEIWGDEPSELPDLERGAGPGGDPVSSTACREIDLKEELCVVEAVA